MIRINFKHISALAGLLICAGTMAHAQNSPSGAEPTKAETKQYVKLIAKPSVKPLNKFLDKYPSSCYAPRITEIRDSLLFAKVDKNDAVAVEDFIAAYPKAKCMDQAVELLAKLNTPLTSAQDAKEAAEELSGKSAGEGMIHIIYRSRNVDHLVILDLMPAESSFENIKMVSYARKNGKFEQETETMLSKYVMDSSLDRSVAAEDADIVMINGRRLIQFTFLNYSSNAAEVTMEYVANLVGTNGENYTNAIFYGMNMDGKAPELYGEYRIEGRSPEGMAQGGLSHEQMHLANLMTANKSLKTISEADALSDDAILWWKDKNPRAMTDASSISFGSLPDEASLVSEYKKVRKENSKQFSAAVMDFRGSTVIVAYNKSSKKYSLVWAEPICKNRKTDRFLADIYFESNGTTLDLFYYKGKTTFKYKINLSSKTIRR